FSSRRRHTRFSRDWSSDVCSSDLSIAFLARQGQSVSWSLVQFPIRGYLFDLISVANFPWAEPMPPIIRIDGRGKVNMGSENGTRSEERRVGKEGRARWWR